MGQKEAKMALFSIKMQHFYEKFNIGLKKRNIHFAQKCQICVKIGEKLNILSAQFCQFHKKNVNFVTSLCTKNVKSERKIKIKT